MLIEITPIKAEAVSLSKVYPISVVEIEVSPWSYEEETKKGKNNDIVFSCRVFAYALQVIATAKELGIAVAAYAYVVHELDLHGSRLTSKLARPLGRGFLTGSIKSIYDLDGTYAHHASYQSIA